MRKYLSIVIPRFDETEKDVFPLLSSINGQVGIDFSDIEVIIANDGDGAGELDKNFLDLFSFDVRQVELKENRGPGVARQVGLDAAKGSYVMFCDADDTLHNVAVIGFLMQETEKTACDILTTSWLEEILCEDGRYIYIPHEIENTWMHGKVFRRQFLAQNNIRFHDDLRVHEDSYFLCIAQSCAEKALHNNMTSYVWKFREKSITRRNNGEYTFASFPTFIQACTLAHSVVAARRPEIMPYKVQQFILYCYFTLHQQHWMLEQNENYLAESEKMFAKCIKPFWKYWDDAPRETIVKIYNEERQRSFKDNLESENIFDWIARMKKD